jgi:hypothetical protein
LVELPNAFDGSLLAKSSRAEHHVAPQDREIVIAVALLAEVDARRQVQKSAYPACARIRCP